MAGALDNFIHIIKENDLQPEDVQKVTAKIWPVAHFKFARENKLTTMEDFHFKSPYAMACAAHRLNPARWLDEDIRQDPGIREFMQRVEFDINEDKKEFGLALLEDPEAGPTSAEVVTKGKTFYKESRYRKGNWRPEEFRNTDEELIEKFRALASKVLPLDKTNKAVQTVFELEKLENVAKLMEMVAP